MKIAPHPSIHAGEVTLTIMAAPLAWRAVANNVARPNHDASHDVRTLGVHLEVTVTMFARHM